MASRSRPAKSTIRGKTFRENQQIFFLLRQDVVIGAKEAADIGEAIFLRGHGAAIGVGKHFAGNFSRSFIGVARLAQLDEVGIFREAASIDV